MFSKHDQQMLSTWFTFGASAAKADDDAQCADEQQRLEQQEREQQRRLDVAQSKRLDEVDAVHLCALHINALVEHDFYEYTSHLLRSEHVDSINVGERVAFVDKDEAKGLLIDGQRRGWFARWLSFAGQPRLADDIGLWQPAEEQLLEVRQFEGWFYQEYDTNGRACEPLTFYSNEPDAADNYVVRYYPSRNLFLVIEDDGAYLSQLVVLNISNTPGDFCSVRFSRDLEIDNVVECYCGAYTSVEFDKETRLVRHNTSDSVRQCEQLGAPLEEDWQTFIDEAMLDDEL